MVSPGNEQGVSAVGGVAGQSFATSSPPSGGGGLVITRFEGSSEQAPRAQAETVKTNGWVSRARREGFMWVFTQQALRQPEKCGFGGDIGAWKRHGRDNFVRGVGARRISHRAA